LDECKPLTGGGTGTTQISGVVTTSGTNAGGTAVVVHGDNFTPATMCKFGSNDPVPAYFVSSTEIVCESPGQGSGATTVEVSNDGFDWTSAGYVFDYQVGWCILRVLGFRA
jgi:hypothetical protein